VAEKAALVLANNQLGFVAIPFTAEGVELYFYSEPDPTASITDSLVYERDDYRLRLVHSPPDFQPFYFKEDFQLLLLRMTNIAGRRAEVEVNAESGRTAWVDGTSVSVQDWKTFLENIAFVKPLDWTANPPKQAPETSAPEVPGLNESKLLQPQKMQGDWLQVKTFPQQTDLPPQHSWIRWRDGEKVLVSWDYVL
ncbi:MAG: hypothetical protein AAGA31_20675, partial [Bacteroidota bacterium]